MNKIIKIMIIIIFFISIFITLLLYLKMEVFGSSGKIIWPKFNDELLDKSIKGYNGEYDDTEFKKIFEKKIDLSLKKQGINNDDINFFYTTYTNNIKIKVNVKKQIKYYSFNLINNFLV